jgi:hypothetical protein
MCSTVVIKTSSGRSGGPAFRVSVQSVMCSIQSDNIKIDNKTKDVRSSENGEEPTPETSYSSTEPLCCL